MRGRSESISLHRTFKAGSHMALQVRASLEIERRPAGLSMMVSSSFCAASGSRRIMGSIVCSSIDAVREMLRVLPRSSSYGIQGSDTRGQSVVKYVACERAR